MDNRNANFKKTKKTKVAEFSENQNIHKEKPVNIFFPKEEKQFQAC